MAAVAAIVAVVIGCSALVVAIRSARHQRVLEAELASLVAAIAEERDTRAAALASAHASTIDEVTTLVENVLVQMETEVTGKVAEALAASAEMVSRQSADRADGDSPPNRESPPT